MPTVPVLKPAGATPAAAAKAVPRPAAGPKPAPAPAPSGMKPEELAELDRISRSLKQMDYFELLHCEKTASPDAIKRAFYQWSRTFHPDRFYQLRDPKLKERVHDVYKRMTEAYYVLKDDRKRAKYLADVSGADRTQKLRFTEMSEVETKQAQKKELDEQVGVHPKGRQFFKTGLTDLEAGRWAAAERNFKMALTFEPQNAKYKDKAKEASDKVFESTRGDQFKIK